MSHAITPLERREAMQLKKVIVPHVPADMSDTWVSVAAWFWLKTNGPGMGAGAHAYDAIGNAGAFDFTLLPLRGHLSDLRRHHPDYPHRWRGVLLQFGRDEPDLRLTYEFEKDLRWMVTMENYKTQLRANRPDFAAV